MRNVRPPTKAVRNRAAAKPIKKVNSQIVKKSVKKIDEPKTYKKLDDNGKLVGNGNLILMSSRDPEERSEIARKGALAAAEKKRQKKSMREVIEMILSCDSKLTDKQKQEAVTLGLANCRDKKLNNTMLLMLSLFKSALRGNISAIEKIQDILGENPWLEARKKESENPKPLAITFLNTDKIKD